MSVHILDLIGDALPEHLPGRSDAWVSVSWSTDDASVLLRLAAEHGYGNFEPGRYISWWDSARRLSVQVSYVSDDDDDEAWEPEPDPSLERAA